MKMPRLVAYPFLAAAYPVLTLAATNRSEIAGLGVLIWPLAISLAVPLTSWFVLRLVTGDPDRQAFLTLMVVVLFASYGYLTIGLEQLVWAAPYAHTVFPFLFLVAYLGSTTYLVFRLARNLHNVTRYLTAFAAILVVWSTVNLIRQTIRWTGFSAESNRPSNNTKAALAPIHRGGPDIYLIILDKYTGSRSLRDNFGFDNSDFENFLLDRGFVLPRTAQANYIYTALSLASLLNYRYLNDLPADPTAESRNIAYVNHLVEDSEVARFLKARGYRFIFFPTAFPVTGANRFADLQLPNPRQIVTEFEIVWRRTTLAQPVLSWVCQRVDCGNAVTPFTAEVPKLLEWKFHQLSQLPKWTRDGRPLFVFAHLTVPHEPYVFNADCSIRPPLWPSYAVVQDETPEKQAYVAQILCLNQRLKGVVENLLQDSPSPPVILLQGDHGHGRMPLHIPDLDNVTPDRIAERAHVFAAYYLPGAGKGLIYDSISPVNVFRSVFRQYFQADLRPLPDKTYWSSGTNLFKFTRVYHGRPWPGQPPAEPASATPALQAPRTGATNR
jgi:hypothetical protein